MEVQALAKYVRVSPKKVIEVTRVIQGRPAAEALDLLRFIPRKTALDDARHFDHLLG